FFRHPSADQSIAPADVDAAQIARARVFHFGSSTMAREPGRAATLAAFEAAAAAGCVLSTDPNLRRHLWESPDEAPPLIRRLAGPGPRFAPGATAAALDAHALRLACARGNRLGAAAVIALGATTAVPHASGMLR